ncbi:hypothetical protein B0H14DRAFT_3506383 [Mycena olivaceomarginata]|nr:hypothetical protein B0H14DRAFT_3506383 [Mycena olivaceomarginata]
MQPPRTTPTTTPTKTNMKAAEMVPDTNTAGHDARYWCLPPMREDPDEVVAVGNGYEFHLVSQGRQVGVWKNWTVAKSMEWQAHCQLGVHPHPVDPNVAKRKGPSRPPRRSLSTPASRRTSGALSAVGGSRPGGIRYFAIWGAGVVYSTKYAARHAFDDAVEDGKDPELLSTDDFEVALAYAEGEFF